MKDLLTILLNNDVDMTIRKTRKLTLRSGRTRLPSYRINFSKIVNGRRIVTRYTIGLKEVDPLDNSKLVKTLTTVLNDFVKSIPKGD